MESSAINNSTNPNHSIIEAEKLILRFNKGIISLEDKNSSLIETIGIEKLDHVKIPLKHACPDCNGLGFHPKFDTEIVEEQCPDCIDPSTGRSTGWKNATCKVCEGSKHNKDGEDCGKCRGRGVYIFMKVVDRTGKVLYPGKKCLKCKGTAKIKIVRKTNVETHICKKCNGTGIYDKVGTPIINKDLAEKLKAKIRKN